MDFARLWEQARDLWARPIGKVIFGVIGVIVIAAAAGSYVLSRPTYATLGSFSATDAPKVATKLAENKILFRQSGASGFTFAVPDDKLNAAKLVLAEVDLDPTSASWSPDLWKNRVSWSNTEFDKRRLMVEQTEINLARAIMSLNVVEKARVIINVPMDKPLFKADEKPPKASVVVQPRKGQVLDISMVEGIMEMVANSVEGLKTSEVAVMDASKTKLLSAGAFQKETSQQTQTAVRSDFMALQERYQKYWQDQLTSQLEKVVGIGNISVIVNPMINWDKVMTEAQEYKGAAPDGKGIIVSQQSTKEISEGSQGGAGQAPAGTISNSEPKVPTYPGQAATQSGNVSSDKNSQIINYLVNQTKTVTEKPGGAIESISVGILVNRAKLVDATAEKAMNDVVTVAMGPKAQVQVAAMPFAEELRSVFAEQPAPSTTSAGAPNLLFWVLGVALGLGGIGFFFVATKPRRPVLEPVFAGPEAAMMGGIPVTESEMPPVAVPVPAAAVPAFLVAQEGGGSAEKKLPETAEELVQLLPEEIANLSDDFLIKLGVDPSKVRMKEKVERIAKVQPEQVASLLRTWITEE